MENASKALIMAAGVLLGVMILALGAFLINMMISYTSDTQKKMDSQILAAFNQQFLKYSSSREITTHDIVGIANFARTNNEKYDVTEGRGSFYVTVAINMSGFSNAHLERASEEDLIRFMKEASLNSDNTVRYFRCTNVEVDDLSGRVNRIVFAPI